MKKTTIGGEPVFLMYFSPNWESPVECSFSILSDTERGLTGKEDRKPLSLSLRTSLKFSIITHRESAAEFRNALKELGNSPVLCPFWPALDRYAGSTKAGIVSGLWLVYEPDMSAWEIYANGSVPDVLVPSAKAKKVPLLWGRFDKAPQPEAVTDEVVPCDIVFTENSPVTMALTVDAQTFSDGPGSINMFPLLPNWAEQVKAGEASYIVTKDEIGFGRVTADAYYDQNGSRRIEQTVACHGWTAIKQMLRFFYNQRGTVGAFWLPMGLAGCRLVSDAQALGSVLEVDNAEGLGDDSHLALIQGTQATGFTIDDVTGNSITLGEPLDRTYRLKQTVVSPLVLSRFESDTFEVSFITDELAVVDSAFVEVPKEYAAVQALEGSSGEADPVAYLYKFEMAGTIWRFTSHERDISDGTNTYAARFFEHSDIKDSINLEKNDITLKSRYFWSDTISDRNPLGYYLPLTIEALMFVEVLQCVPDSEGDIVGGITTLFSGQVSSVSFDGPYLEAKCTGKGSLFDKLLPTLLLQPTCNYSVYSAACGLSLANWKMVATVLDYTEGSYEVLISSPAFVIASPTPARPVVVVFEHFFAGGKFEIGDTEAGTFERRGILDSVALGENIKITLRHPLARVPTLGIEQFNLWAGCDGRGVTCREYNDDADWLSNINLEGKFGNFSNFGGFPYIPIGNPTIAKVNKDKSQGGKK